MSSEKFALKQTNFVQEQLITSSIYEDSVTKQTPRIFLEIKSFLVILTRNESNSNQILHNKARLQ